MLVNTELIPEDVSQVDFVFSIYGGGADKNFGKIKNPAVRVKCADNTSFIIPLEGKLDERTVIALEVVRKADYWELTPLGMMYGHGMDKLCGIYGIKVSN
jgi:stress response protein SCP2